MNRNEIIGFGLIGVIVLAFLGIVALAILEVPIRRDGKCINGLVYSVDKGMNPTFNRLDADGKPQRCTEAHQ